MIKLTEIQGFVLERIKEGWSRAQIAAMRDRTDAALSSVYTALRKKGVTGKATPGPGRCVPVLVKASEYITAGEPEIQPEWVTPTVRQIARAILGLSVIRDDAYTDLPVLADALEDAGCDSVILAMLRTPCPDSVDVDTALPVVPYPAPVNLVTSESEEWQSYLAQIRAHTKRHAERRLYEDPALVWLWKARRLCERLAD